MVHLQKLSLLALILAFTWSCNGQKNNTTTKEANTQTEITNDYLFAPNVEVNANDIPTNKYVPLFYKGQLAHWIRTINEDANGNLWFGTNHYGVIRYNNETLTYFTTKEGFGDSRVSAAITDAHGTIYFGTSQGITKYNGQLKTVDETKRFSYLTTENGLVHNEIWTMITDSKGLMWIGTTEGVSQFDGNTFSTFNIPKSDVVDPKAIMSYNRITCIYEDSQGNYWFGTDGYGLCKYDGNSFTHFTKTEGLCDNNISSIIEDNSGNIWIGTMFGGVSIYDGKTFNNLAEKGLINGVETSAFYKDANGSIWFSIEHEGVYCFNGKTFTNYNANSGLGSTGIITIFKDSKNRFWFGGWKGLFRFNGKRFDTITKQGPWDVKR